MAISIPSSTLEKFTTFGDLLRFLRRRVGITQVELALAVGYSDTQISRLEQNQRPPDIPTIEARFISALDVENEPKVVARLLDLAANVRREDSPGLGLCPYKGLSYFDETDADLFVGREALTETLTERVFSLLSDQNRSLSRILAVVGASGSGKSSLVRAGLVPTLRWDKKSSDWHIHIITPTAHPLESLATSLTIVNSSVTTTATLIDDLTRDPRSLHLFSKRKSRSDSGARLLLVVDQFEELFSLCRSAEERVSFIDNLLTAASTSSGPVIVVIALRADFYAHCAKYKGLREALAKNQEYIGSMNQDELRRAILEPAERGRWELEAGLVDVLLHDVGQEPGALPLLSHALLETWQRRRGRTLTLGGYASSGGVHGAIAETAEAVFADQFTNEQKEIARRIFLRLTELSDDESAVDTRRRVKRDELILKPEEASATRSVLKALADARLIVTDDDSVEVTHEALIREWPTLRGWLEENREGLRLHRQLTEAAKEWFALEHTPDMLYRGVRLAQAREWVSTNQEEMNPLEREFLAASIEAGEREAAEKEAQRQRELEAARKLAEVQSKRAEEQERSAGQLRKRALYLAGAFTLALAMTATALFFGARAREAAILAQDSERTAFSRELAVQSRLNLPVDPERSILLALAALNQAYSQEAENALHEALSSSRLRLSLQEHEGPVYNVSFSPDGKWIASAGGDKTARMWDANTGDELVVLAHPAEVGKVDFSPDGLQLATSAGDGLVRLWEVKSGRELVAMIGAKKPAAIDPRIVDFAFSPVGKLLAIVDRGEGELRLWNPETGMELFTLSDPTWLNVVPGVDLLPNRIAFSPNGKMLAVSLISGGAGLGRIELWDVATRQKVQTLDGQFDLPFPFVFNPDGTRILTPYGSTAPVPTVWDVESGSFLHIVGEPVNTIQYSMDGNRLLSASYGGIAKVFDAETREELLALPGHTGRVFKVAESPECEGPPTAPFAWCGPRLATASDDGTVKVWDISPAGNRELLTLPGLLFGLSPDGTRLETLTMDRGLHNPGLEITIQSWSLSRDVLSDQTSDYASASIEWDEEIPPSWLWFFSEEGILAAAFEDGPLKFLDVENEGKPLYSTSCCGWKEGMALSFSNREEPRVAIGDPQTGMVRIWDPVADENIQTLQVAGQNELVAFTDPASLQTGNLFYRDNPLALSQDGERLATLKNDRSVDLWEVSTGQKFRTFPGPALVDGAHLWFSPDGNWLVIADCTGNAVVHDVLTGGKVFRYSNDGACITGLAFNQEKKLIALTSAQLETKILNYENWQEVLTLPGGWMVQFTPDGRRVIIGRDEPRGLAKSAVRMYLVELEDVIALAKLRLTRSLRTEECQQYLHIDQCPDGLGK